MRFASCRIFGQLWAAAALLSAAPATSGAATSSPTIPSPSNWAIGRSTAFLRPARSARMTPGGGNRPIDLEVNYGARRPYPAAPCDRQSRLQRALLRWPRPSWGRETPELGFKYRFITPSKSDWFPQVGIFPLLEVPTGDARRNLGSGNVDAFLPVWIQKDFGKWLTYGGGGYWINPGPGNRDFWYTGWLLQRQVTDKLALGAEVFHTDGSTRGSFRGHGVQPRRPV